MKETDVVIFCIQEKEKGICLFEFAQVRYVSTFFHTYKLYFYL